MNEIKATLCSNSQFLQFGNNTSQLISLYIQLSLALRLAPAFYLAKLLPATKGASLTLLSLARSQSGFSPLIFLLQRLVRSLHLSYDVC